MRLYFVGRKKSYVVRRATISRPAEVAELADAPDSKSGSLRGVWVRFPPSASAVRCVVGRGWQRRRKRRGRRPAVGRPRGGGDDRGESEPEVAPPGGVVIANVLDER